MTAKAQLGPKQSEGQRLLRVFLKMADDTGGDRGFGSKLGVSGPTVHSWKWGMKSPTAAHREAIAKLTNGLVPAESWILDSDRAPAPLARTGTTG